MAKKDIRITFFYADETIWALAKKNKTTIRLVKWANEFFDRYDFQIDEHPISFSERVYKKKFSFAKTKGVKADLAVFHKWLDKLDDLNKVWSEKLQQLRTTDTSSPDWDALLKEINDIKDEYVEGTKQLGSPVEFELLFRKKIYDITQGLSLTKERLPIIFCDFKDQKGTMGLTRKLDLFWGIGFWSLRSVTPNVMLTSMEIHTRPFVLLDIRKMTKSHEHALAHEIVHAAGDTTPDGQGPKGDIMNKEDTWNKAPLDVTLSDDDKKKLEVSFFVA